MTERFLSRLAGSLAASAALTATASPAQAGAYAVLRAAGDARIIIDPTAVEQVPGGAVRRAWTVTVQRNIASSPPPQPGYVRSANEYDCAAQTMRWRTFSAYARSGELLVSRKNPSDAWTPVTAADGALGEWRVVCGLSSGDSVMAADSVAKLVVALMASFDVPAEAPPRPAVRPRRAGRS
jgi:hypothetical protein